MIIYYTCKWIKTKNGKQRLSKWMRERDPTNIIDKKAKSKTISIKKVENKGWGKKVIWF